MHAGAQTRFGRLGRAGSCAAFGALAALVAGSSPPPAALRQPAVLHQPAAAPLLGTIGPALKLPGRSSAYTTTGALPGGTRLTVALALRLRDPGGLAAYAAAVNDPASPSFRHFMSIAQIARRYGPTTGAVGDVVAALRRSGLQVGSLPADHLLVRASGSARQLEAAFHVSIAAYRLRGGATGYAAAGVPLFDAKASRQIASVVGLDQLATAHSSVALSSLPPAQQHDWVSQAAPGTSSVQSALAGAGASSVAGLPSPCPAALADANSSSGWTEDAIANAYGFAPLLTGGDLGAGETIAVYELEPFSRSDVAAFERCYFGRSQLSRLRTVALDGFSFRGPGLESVLDIEELAALAPAAKLIVYEAPNTTYGQLDEYNAIVSQDRANVVSTSWAECETQAELSAPGSLQVENTIFEEAAAEGMTVVAASGDAGSDSCAATQFGTTAPAAPYLSVDDPASQPYVLGVGGVSLESASPVAQRAWNDGAGGGGGGGRSNTWPSPTWQAGSGVPGILAGRRQVPDVSGAADQLRGVTFYLSSSPGGESVPPPAPPPAALRVPASTVSGGWTVIGGTSVSTPQWAAALALVAGSKQCAALPRDAGGRDLGFVAPALYAVASQPKSYAASFTQVLQGDNDIFHLGHGYAAGPGYNMATGLGTPVLALPSGAPALAANLCAVALGQPLAGPALPAVTSVSPASGPVGGGESVTISGSGFGSSVTGVRVLFGSSPARVESVSPATIVAVTPRAHRPPGTGVPGAQAVDVTVTIAPTTSGSGGGEATSSPSVAARYDYVAGSASSPLPTVTGVAPDGGPPAGGGTVTVYGDGFRSGSGVSSVSFGGVPASFTVLSNGAMRVAAPPLSAVTACSRGAGFDPANDCQVQVVVSNTSGSSATAAIEPGVSGAVHFDSAGIVVGVPGREIAETPTEYDYAPAPVVTSVSPDPAPASGSTPVVVHGRHFSLLTLEWVDFGPADDTNSQQFRFTRITPTEITVYPPPGPVPAAGTSAPLAGGVTVQSLSGVSNTVPFSYSGG